MLKLGLKLDQVRIALKAYGQPLTAFRALHRLRGIETRYFGREGVRKMVAVNGRYRWRLYIPGWPGPAYRNFFAGELNRLAPVRGKANRLANAFLAITKKCPMHCEHCFEWDALNKPDVLSLDDLRTMVGRFSDLGIGQIQLTGGEPMTRLDDMLEIIRTSPKDIEFWVLSSGALVTPANARRLKEAGLTGIVVSLDHFDRDAHNAFRGHPQAYDWALRAITSANDAGLVTALSLCATRSFISEANLMTYADLARHLGVSFIQVLEPRAEGHYAGKDVELHPEQIAILDTFFRKMNNDKAYADYPIVNYHGYVQHKYGCLLAGDRSIYVDTDGDMLACPFCRTKGGSALADDYKETLERIRNSGCHLFGHAELEARGVPEEAY